MYAISNEGDHGTKTGNLQKGHNELVPKLIMKPNKPKQLCHHQNIRIQLFIKTVNCKFFWFQIKGKSNIANKFQDLGNS